MVNRWFLGKQKAVYLIYPAIQQNERDSLLFCTIAEKPFLPKNTLFNLSPKLGGME